MVERKLVENEVAQIEKTAVLISHALTRIAALWIFARRAKF
jgi:hypothetical protein